MGSCFKLEEKSGVNWRLLLEDVLRGKVGKLIQFYNIDSTLNALWLVKTHVLSDFRKQS